MFNALAELGLNWLLMAAVDSLLAHDLDFRVFPIPDHNPIASTPGHVVDALGVAGSPSKYVLC